MTLPPETLAKREGKFTSSIAPPLMTGDQEMVMQNFRIGIKEIPQPPPTFQMRAGSEMQSFLLNEYEQEKGFKLTRRDEVVQHPTLPWVCCTPDGVSEDEGKVVEVKWVGGFENADVIFDRYCWQVIVQMRCLALSLGSLWVMRCNQPPVEYPIEIEDFAEVEPILWERAAAYMICLQTFTPPYPVPAVHPPEKWTTIDLNVIRPNWAAEMISHLQAWSQSRVAAATHAEATAAIKDLLPQDCGRLHYSGITISRNRRGAVSIKEAA